MAALRAVRTGIHARRRSVSPQLVPIEREYPVNPSPKAAEKKR